jgi:hypothetical protein
MFKIKLIKKYYIKRLMKVVLVLKILFFLVRTKIFQLQYCFCLNGNLLDQFKEILTLTQFSV